MDRLTKFNASAAGCLGFFLLFSCSPQAKTKLPSHQDSANSTSHELGAEVGSDIALYVVDVANSDPMDSAKLQIDTITVATMRDKTSKKLVGLLNFFGSPGADYAEIVVSANGEPCKEPSVCFQKTSTLTRELLPVLEAGKYVVRVRACLNTARSTNTTSPCGPWNEEIFDQPSNDHLSQEERSLREERQRYAGELRDLAKKLGQSLDDFETAMNKCEKNEATKQKLAGYRILVGNFVRLGDRLVEEGIQYFDRKARERSARESENVPETTLPVEKPAPEKPVPEEAESGFALRDRESRLELIASEATILRAIPQQFASNLQRAAALIKSQSQAGQNGLRLVGIVDSIEDLTGISGRFGARTPISAVSVLSKSIFDLATATQQAEAASPCLAKLQHSRVMTGLNREITLVQNRIAEIDTQLEGLNK